MTFLVPLLALVGGILFGELLPGELWGGIFILAGLAIFFRLQSESKNPLAALRLRWHHYIWVAFLFFGIGLIDSGIHRPDEIPPDRLAAYVAAEGKVVSAETLAKGDRLIVDVTSFTDSLRVAHKASNCRVAVSTDGFYARRGDIIVFPASLKPVSDNPNFRSKGYAGRMKRKGILYATSLTCNDIRLAGHKNGIRRSAELWRDRLEIKIEKSSLSRECSEFIIALLLGDKSMLSEEVKEAFSEAGVAHILALSGTHIAIIMGIVLLILYPLKYAGWHLQRYWIAVAAIWIYAFFSGLAPSTVRSTIMATFVVTALSFQRRNFSANALLAAIMVILLFDPTAIYDVGMQLSALCVASILAFSDILNKVGAHFHPKLHAVNSAVIVSLSATFATWALVSFYFKKVPLLFLPANLLILPMLAPLMSVALAYLACLAVGLDPFPLAWLLNHGYGLLEGIVGTISGFGAGISHQASWLVVVVWTAGVAALAVALRMSRPALPVALSCCLLLSAVAVCPHLLPGEPDGFIIQKGYHDISVALYDADEEFVVTFPSTSISSVRHKGVAILCVDRPADADTFAEALAKARGGRRNMPVYVVLGGGFKTDSIPGCEALTAADRIVIHPSVRRKREAKLLENAAEAGLTSPYSLRRFGALRVDIR